MPHKDSEARRSYMRDYMRDRRAGKKRTVASSGWKEAKELGLQFYTTGRPCKRGHIAPRYVSTKQCTECHREWRRTEERRAYDAAYRREHYEAHLAYERARYASTIEWQRARAAAWRAAHQEQIATYNATWKEKNPGVAAARAHAWNQANPKRRSEITREDQRRRCRVKGNGRLSRGLIKLLLSEQGGQCPYCRGELNASSCSVDHYVPLTRGGLHVDSNIQLTCGSCNFKKHANDPAKFEEETFSRIVSTKKLGNR